MALRVHRARAALRAAASLAAQPSAIFAAAFVAGATCAVTGIHMLAGTPWALLTGAAIAFVLAWIILRGMNG